MSLIDQYTKSIDAITVEKDKWSITVEDGLIYINKNDNYCGFTPMELKELIAHLKTIAE